MSLEILLEKVKILYKKKSLRSVGNDAKFTLKALLMLAVLTMNETTLSVETQARLSLLQNIAQASIEEALSKTLSN